MTTTQRHHTTHHNTCTATLMHEALPANKHLLNGAPGGEGVGACMQACPKTTPHASVMGCTCKPHPATFSAAFQCGTEQAASRSVLARGCVEAPRIPAALSDGGRAQETHTHRLIHTTTRSGNNARSGSNAPRDARLASTPDSARMHWNLFQALLEDNIQHKTCE